MRAVVKDDERPHQEPGGRKRQGQGQQIRDVKCQVHQDRHGQVRHDRGDDVEHASPEGGMRVGGEVFTHTPGIRWKQNERSDAGVEVAGATPPRPPLGRHGRKHSLVEAARPNTTGPASLSRGPILAEVGRHLARFASEVTAPTQPRQATSRGAARGALAAAHRWQVDRVGRRGHRDRLVESVEARGCRRSSRP